MALMQPRRTGATAAFLIGGLVASCSPGPTPSPPAPRATRPAAAGVRSPGASDAVPIVRLPADVRPARQRVELEVVPERASFSGRVEIDLELDRPRQDLCISARDLILTRGVLGVGGRSLSLGLATELHASLAARVGRYPGALYALAKVTEQTRLCAALVAAQRRSATEFFSKRRSAVRGGGDLLHLLHLAIRCPGGRLSMRPATAGWDRDTVLVARETRPESFSAQGELD